MHLEGRPFCPGASLPIEDQVPQLLETLPRDDVRGGGEERGESEAPPRDELGGSLVCLLYTSDAADE